MGQTPFSSATPYLTAAQLLQFKDARAVGQLCEDSNTQLSPTQIASDPNVAAALSAASGMAEMFLLGSQRYTPTDIQNLNGVSQQFLQSLLADITMYKLYGRRDAPMPPETVVQQYEKAIENLTKLSTGELILSFLEAASAGTAEDVDLGPSQILTRNLLSSRSQRAIGPRYNIRGGGTGGFF